MPNYFGFSSRIHLFEFLSNLRKLIMGNGFNCRNIKCYQERVASNMNLWSKWFSRKPCIVCLDQYAIIYFDWKWISLWMVEFAFGMHHCLALVALLGKATWHSRLCHEEWESEVFSICKHLLIVLASIEINTFSHLWWLYSKTPAVGTRGSI